MHTIDLRTIDIRALDERAVLATIEVARRIRPSDLERSTPCAAWNLVELLAHMAVQHDGFAAAAAGDGADIARWQVRPLDDPVGDYIAAAERVIDAFRPDDVTTRRFALPEISSEITFSGRTALGFHCVDYVVHGWDVARSLGGTFEPDDELAAVALAIAGQVPDGPARLEPGAAFAPSRAGATSATPVIDEVVAMLGRDPAWSSD